MKNRKLFFAVGIMLFTTAFTVTIRVNAFANPGAKSTKWKAPKSADAIKSPLQDQAKAAAQGKALSKQFCAICHGNTGKGDGVAGAALNPRPANFTLPEVQKQTDGAIFWKLTNGKPPMAPYKDLLTEKQRWQLVSYIRELGKK